MEKKDASISIKTDASFKQKVISEVKTLGISISEFGESCLKKVILKEELDLQQKEKIMVLERELKKLKDQLKEKESDIKLAQKLNEDNQIILESSKQLTEVLKIQEVTISNQKSIIQDLKTKEANMIERVKHFAKHNSGIRIGFFGYMEEREILTIINE